MLPKKPGYIYIMHIPHNGVEWSFENDLYKIGYTSFLKSRLTQIKYQWNQPACYIAFAPVEDVISSERQILKKYDRHRCCERISPWIKNLCEYFLFDPNTLNEAIFDVWKLCNRNAIVEKPIVTTSDIIVDVCKKNLALLEEVDALKQENRGLQLQIKEKTQIYDERSTHLIKMINQLVRMTPYYDYDLERFAREYVNRYFYSNSLPLPTDEEFRKMMNDEILKVVESKC